MEEKVITGIYIRVSTEDQAREFDYYIDDGISGKNLDGRPEVTRMLKDVEEGKINNVLIYKLDRLTRSVRDLIYLIELFEKHSCTFNSQTEKIDTSNAVGRMFVKIIGIFAEFERENLAERVSFGYEQKTREGNYTNTQGVYGYDYIPKEQKLVVNIEEKDLVNRPYGVKRIAFKLNEENVPTKRGGHWSATTISSIIHNPLYIGKVRYGVGKKNKERAFTVDGNSIEPIIDLEKWNKANRIIETRKHFNVRRYPNENSYFFHIIKCGNCGGNMSARQQTQNGKLYITYTCNNACRGFTRCKGFSHKKMEDAFLKYLDTLNSMEPDESVMKKNDKENDLQRKIDILNSKMEKLDAKAKSVRNQFINDLLSVEEYHELNREIEKQKKVYCDEISEFNNKNTKSKSTISYDDIKSIITNIKLNWEYLINKEKQLFLERFIEYINVSKKDNEVIISKVQFRNV